ncbi:MAG: TetR/AcrR family transcriptional regulator [Chromatiales bacterium]|nr:TetR/AcrR family transcriptional regulator [Chromatiales bacterium]
MKTRDRILQTSLQLFNEYGEPRITTNHIADELDISPGNLYYHFRNKDEIIALLFQQFERQMDTALQVPERRVPNMEDMWLYLHLVFENIWEYRFLYRDLDNILSRNKKLRTHFPPHPGTQGQYRRRHLQGICRKPVSWTPLPRKSRHSPSNIAVVATLLAELPEYPGQHDPRRR